MNWLLKKIHGDRWIWFSVMTLSVISILAVFSSTGILMFKNKVSIVYYLAKHGSMIIAGLVIMYLTHLVNYRYYSRIAQILLYISIPLLIYTLFFGTKINEASRWVSIPVLNQTFQTSDLAKLALFMYLARELARRQEKIKNFKQGFLPIFTAVTGVCGLIAPANLSTSLMLFGTSMLLLLIGRVSFKQMAVVALSGTILVALIVFFGPRRGVYRDRINTYLNPDKVSSDMRYQRNQANIAIALGGLVGKGPGNSYQRNFLPSPYADFVYAIIAEEYGFVGALGIVFIYLLFLYRCVRIVTKSPKAFGALLAAALGFSLVIQAFANIAVVVNIFPVTGIPLPLVSMGGTSILFTSMALGIILSVSRDIEEKEKMFRTETV